MSLDDLSKREREVVELLRLGLSNKETASRLGITEKTIASHRAHINAKLGVHATRELLVLLHAEDVEKQVAARLEAALIEDTIALEANVDAEAVRRVLAAARNAAKCGR